MSTFKALGVSSGAFSRLWKVFMSNAAALSVTASNGWAVFWMQLPVLVLAVAVIIVATTALWRARPEDVPRIFEAFTAAFGRRTGHTVRRRNRRKAMGEPRHEEIE